MNTLYYAYIIHASVFRITKNSFHVKENENETCVN